MQKFLLISASLYALCGCGEIIPLDQYGDFKNHKLNPTRDNVELGQFFDTSTTIAVSTKCITGTTNTSTSFDSETNDNISTDFNAKASVEKFIDISGSVKNSNTTDAKFSAVGIKTILDSRISINGNKTDKCADWIDRLLTKNINSISYFSSLLYADSITVKKTHDLTASLGATPGEDIKSKINLADASLKISHEDKDSITISGKSQYLAYIPKTISLDTTKNTTVPCNINEWCQLGPPFAEIIIASVEDQVELLLNDRKEIILDGNGKPLESSIKVAHVRNKLDDDGIYTKMNERSSGFSYLGDSIVKYEVRSIDTKNRNVTLYVSEIKVNNK